MTAIDIIHELNISCKQVNAALKRYLCTLSQQKTPLIQAMRYSTLIGGKRIRPFLVYQTGKLFGIVPAILDAPAAAIECIHIYSLIHDDLPSMDNDVTRRGQPTCHVKFNESIAILAGNALQTLAFNILAETTTPHVTNKNKLDMITTLAEACGANGMCLGQSLDIGCHKQKISAKYLDNINMHKTGALIRAAVRLGTLAAGNIVSKNVIKLLDRYATSIGLAFQVQDDILDHIYYNKTKNYQIENLKNINNNSFSTLLSLNAAKDKIKKLYYQSLSTLHCISKLGYDTEILSKLVKYLITRDK